MRLPRTPFLAPRPPGSTGYVHQGQVEAVLKTIEDRLAEGSAAFRAWFDQEPERIREVLDRALAKARGEVYIKALRIATVVVQVVGRSVSTATAPKAPSSPAKAPGSPVEASRGRRPSTAPPPLESS